MITFELVAGETFLGQCPKRFETATQVGKIIILLIVIKIIAADAELAAHCIKYGGNNLHSAGVCKVTPCRERLCNTGFLRYIIDILIADVQDIELLQIRIIASPPVSPAAKPFELYFIPYM